MNDTEHLKRIAEHISVRTHFDGWQGQAFRIVLLMLGMVIFLFGCAPNQKPDKKQEQSESLKQPTSGDTEVTSIPLALTKNRIAPRPINVNLIGNARAEQFVKVAMIEVADIYQQCGLSLSIQVNSKPEEVSSELSEDTLVSLSGQHAPYPPTVYVIGTTRERDVAFSFLPSLNRDVSGTAWITDRVSDACFAWVVAHEIGHIALNSAVHHPRKRNVMNRFCSNNSNFNRSTALPYWDDEQCTALRDYFTMER